MISLEEQIVEVKEVIEMYQRSWEEPLNGGTISDPVHRHQLATMRAVLRSLRTLKKRHDQ